MTYKQGVSTELFPNERDVAPGCLSIDKLEDITHIKAERPRKSPQTW